MLSDKGIYQELKWKTERVKKYLVNTSSKILGRAAWERRFQCKLRRLNHATVPTRHLIEFAHVIASDLKDVFLTPKVVINNLKDAIRLRKQQSLLHKPDGFSSTEAWNEYHTHQNFIAILKSILGTLLNGMNQYRGANFAETVKELDSSQWHADLLTCRFTKQQKKKLAIILQSDQSAHQDLSAGWQAMFREM